MKLAIGWYGSVEIAGYMIASETCLDNVMITHVSSKLTNTVDCGFVLWSHEIKMTIQYM